jgi:spoIIIJ-associated protein
MESAEGTGKTLEEAQQAALEQLGVPAERVDFEVVQRPGALLGIFGRVGFRVRAVAREEEPETLEEEVAAESAEEVPAEREVTPAEPPHHDLARAAHELLQRMVDLMGIEGAVEIAGCTEDEVCLNVTGESLGLLIGRHGATLDAVQLIVAIGANRQVEEGARVIVDAEDYRERHRQMIEAKARKHAEEARRTGKEVVIPNLKGYERRVMHLALRDDPDVSTYSEGEGDDRVLVISPK